MKKIILFLLLNLMVFNIHSQDLNGIWYSSYWQAIGEDTTYSQTGFIFDFIDSENFVFKALFGEQETFKYDIKEQLCKRLHKI